MREKAQQIVTDIVGSQQTAHKLPRRRNWWTQPAGTGMCGVAVVHYMEEEIRASRGEGLGQEQVDCKTMTKRLQAFEKVLTRRKSQQLEIHKPVKELLDATGKERLDQEHKWALARVAATEAGMKKSAMDKPVEYRCSRCRWSKAGTGCDSKQCNPHKYLEKMELLLKSENYDWDKWALMRQAAVIDVDKGGGPSCN